MYQAYFLLGLQLVLGLFLFVNINFFYKIKKILFLKKQYEHTQSGIL